MTRIVTLRKRLLHKRSAGGKSEKGAGTVSDLKVALSGFATLDYVAHTERRIVEAGTNPITIAAGSWPRAGGAPLYAGKVLADSGCCVSLIVPIGRDQAGKIYADEVKANGLSTETLTLSDTVATPTCVLVYQPEGDYCCFLDDGNMLNATLSVAQAEAINAAGWVVMTAAPKALSEQVLATIQSHQKLAWIVKADTECFPSELACKIFDRSSVIFCNKGERNFLAAAGCSPTRQIIFETDGERGVRVFNSGRSDLFSTTKLAVIDPTGAGDTFTGGALSVLVKDITALKEAAEAGLRAAYELLERRHGAENSELDMTSTTK